MKPVYCFKSLFAATRRNAWLGLVASSLCALAQAPIIDDASLGLNGGDLTANGNVVTIGQNLGQTVGNNLFHSFTRFNVPENTTAAFQGPATVQNVIARVTGTETSAIDGVIDTQSAMPMANFFLMNPNGISFGSGAKLDVGGSMAFTTADELGFTDGASFPAAIPVSEVLSVAPIDRFGFTAPQPADISMTGGVVPPNPDFNNPQYLPGVVSLVAGDIRLETQELRSLAFNAAAVGDDPISTQTRNISFDPTDPASTPQGETRGSVQMDTVLTESILSSTVRAGNIDMDQTFFIGLEENDAGLGVLVEAGEDFTARDSLISSGPGDVVVSARNISLTRGDELFQFFGADQGPFIEISTTASETLFFSGVKAGDVRVTATENLTVEGWSIISLADLDNATGDIHVHAGGTLRVSEGTGAQADTGEIVTIASHGPIPVGGTENRVGDVNVTAQRIEMIGAAEIGSASFRDLADERFRENVDFSPSGNVNVTAHESISIDASKPAGIRNEGITTANPGINSQFPGEIKPLPAFKSTAFGPAVGDAGDISITIGGEGRLTLANGARISSSGSRVDSANTASDAGEININARHIDIDGGDGQVKSGIFARSFLQTGTTAGGINIKGAETIRLSNGAEISSESLHQLAGSIRMSEFLPNAEARFDASSLTTRSGGAGAAGGDIIVDNAHSLILRDTEVNSSATGSGGRGGNISLSSTIFLRHNTVIDASASSGVSGAVSGADIPVNLSDVVSPVQAVPVGDSLRLPEQSAVFQSRDISGHAVRGRSRRPRVPERWQLTFGEDDAGSQ